MFRKTRLFAATVKKEWGPLLPAVNAVNVTCWMEKTMLKKEGF
jgi:hypothetical protein